MALKNRVRLSSSVDTEINNQLKKLSEETRIPISRLLDEAIQDLINKHNNNNKYFIFKVYIYFRYTPFYFLSIPLDGKYIN